MELGTFDARYGPEIAGWVVSADEARAWCGHRGPSLPGPDVFARWHAEPDVHPYVLLRDGAPVAYGEIWVDEAEREIELARLLVMPAARGRGVGRRLVALLLERAAAFGLADVFVRVVPGNTAAIACYRHAGFARVPEADEDRFNRNQPVAYAWFQFRSADGV